MLTGQLYVGAAVVMKPGQLMLMMLTLEGMLLCCLGS